MHLKRETLTTGFIRGDSVQTMAKRLAERLDASRSNALRLIRTESSHIHNTAELDAYNECGFEEYEFMASLGECTCEVCGGMDGKRIKLTDKQFGVNFPPLHPNCRCTTIAFDPDDDLSDFKAGELEYEQWYAKYVEGREQPKLESKGGAEVEVPSGKPVPVSPTSEKKNAVQTLTAGGDSGIIIKEIKNTGIRGDIHIPPAEIDADTLTFDKSHIIAERTHNISEDEAKSFIKNSNVSISRWNGRFENYFSSDGAAYVDTEEKTIRTAFSNREYDDVVKAMMEVLKKYGKL